MATGLAERFVSLVRTKGWRRAVHAALRVALRLPRVVDADTRRLELSQQFDRQFDATVRYGPFRGLALRAASWWGANDRASMLFGLYEQEVLQALQSAPGSYDTLIDLGAADGYYGVGVLVGGLFRKSYCFEMSPAGRDAIRANAVANGVSERLEVFGTAEPGFYRHFDEEERNRSLVLVDIEGGEFDLFDADAFRAFRRSVLIIELHDWFHADGVQRLERLRSAALPTHTISEITMAARDLSPYPELRALTDTDRWLVCSEGRARGMTWLRLDPIEAAAEPAGQTANGA